MGGDSLPQVSHTWILFAASRRIWRSPRLRACRYLRHDVNMQELPISPCDEKQLLVVPHAPAQNGTFSNTKSNQVNLNQS